MYVCVCNAVTEKQIFKAAQAGAKHLGDLKKTLGVTKECGRCAGCAKACLRDAHHEISTSNAAALNKTIHITVQAA